MNAELLLDHFDRIVEAPGAVSRLRRFVLDLAVRGKLVPQKVDEGTAQDVLEAIGGLGSSVPFQEGMPAEPPFLLPESWQWVRLNAVVNFSIGKTPSRHEDRFWNSKDYQWVSIADMADGGVVTRTKEAVSSRAYEEVFKGSPSPVGTILMSFKLTVGRVSRLGVSAFHNEAIISIYPLLQELDPYLFRFLGTFSQWAVTKNAIKGATLNKSSLNNLLLALPPLAEQHRIVAKVNELMALCDELEQQLEVQTNTAKHLLESVLDQVLAG